MELSPVWCTRWEKRIKLDPKTHPEVELNFEEKPTRWRAVWAGY